MSTNEIKLTEIAERVAACTSCGLSQSRTRTVFGEGNPASPMVIVGEGPGQQEDLSGRPFVGKSGQLLDECLAANKINRKHVYICNFVRCRACDIENVRARNRPPTPEETASCRPWLAETLSAISPLVILCLGAASANAIIKKGFRITTERGQWFTSLHASSA